MKKTIKFFIAMMIAVVSLNQATAQNYKSIEFDLGFRYDILTGDYTGGGLGVFLEPRYNINDKFAVGLRLGIDLLGGTLKDSELKVSSSVLSSYIVTGDYMLVNKGNKRVFAGLGLGFSGQGSLELETDIDTPTPSGGPEVGTVFGIVPRIGAKLGILKLALDYSIYPKDGAKSFIGVNVGLSFGGRMKK